MTVVPFPHDSRYRELTAAEQARMLVIVVSGMRMLGEPSTLEELTLYAQRRFARDLQPRLKDDVEAILHTYAEPGPTPLADFTPFRRVQTGEQEAWAFSASFRSALAESGLEVRLRNLAD
ncbi:MAG: hypothetical protein V4820_03645 [Pseudomonadota bacterium]|uniref:hypothetical protein n=1 Tax=Phenylobacterium sp. TaxID=1871053 RepID=UPI002728A67F|nr:hypothetical protein [Phenylobacterium sp.]MDO9430778.1 hypothetical protein [Phenylobacterium sp.]